MSDDTVIKVEEIVKTYKLYNSPFDRVKEAFDPLRRKYHHEFNALKHVSFELNKGDSVGIIGRNGSGKSTLLKILTSVLSPTSGKFTVNGRISALLELGSGFNPEMTGLENVYFNGLLMGYTREAMNECLDEILTFADIGEFVNQPVKTYSSGMFIRLAFAVAINVDPDILIVDEALSVGDELFQRKCFSRILDFKERGKTILFVSHGASTIIELCTKAMIIDDGELLVRGNPKQVVSLYQKMLYSSTSERTKLRNNIRGLEIYYADKNEFSDTSQVVVDVKSVQNKAYYSKDMVPTSTLLYESNGAVIKNPQITTLDGKKVNILVRGEEYLYNYSVDFVEDSYNVRFGMMIKTLTGLEIYGSVSHLKSDLIPLFKAGQKHLQSFRFRCALLPGTYYLNAGVLGEKGEQEVYLHRIIDIAMFRVQEEPNLLSSGILDLS